MPGIDRTSQGVFSACAEVVPKGACDLTHSLSILRVREGSSTGGGVE